MSPNTDLSLRALVGQMPSGFLPYQWLLRALQEGLICNAEQLDQQNLEQLLDKDGGASIELHLGSQCYVTGTEGPRHLSETEDVLIIPPGEFALLTTEETVDMFSDTLALISIKSGIKQKGLVNVSGFHVDPGYCGRITWSVFNAGPTDLMLERGQKLFQMFVNVLPEATERSRKKPRVERMGIDSVAQLAGRRVSLRSLEDRVSKMEQFSQVYIGLIIALIVAVVTLLLQRPGG